MSSDDDGHFQLGGGLLRRRGTIIWNFLRDNRTNKKKDEDTECPNWPGGLWHWESGKMLKRRIFD